jgi:hypothetical protein
MEYDIDVFHFCGVVFLLLLLFFRVISKLWEWISRLFANRVAPALQQNRSLGIILAIAGLVIIIILFAVSSSPSTPAATPTRTPGATQTETRTQQRQPTTTPRPVSVRACVTDSTIRIRKGPGTEYEPIDGMTSGTCMSIVGRNSDSSWVYMISEDDKQGWVFAPLLTIEGNLNRVTVRSASDAMNVAPTVRAAPTSTRKPLVFATNTPRPVVIQPTAQDKNCSSAYPGVCIPSGPDLDCGDIPYRRFRVLPPDPHLFDMDGDGIGCE